MSYNTKYIYENPSEHLGTIIVQSKQSEMKYHFQEKNYWAVWIQVHCVIKKSEKDVLWTKGFSKSLSHKNWANNRLWMESEWELVKLSKLNKHVIPISNFNWLSWSSLNSSINTEPFWMSAQLVQQIWDSPFHDQCCGCQKCLAEQSPQVLRWLSVQAVVFRQWYSFVHRIKAQT